MGGAAPATRTTTEGSWRSSRAAATVGSVASATSERMVGCVRTTSASAPALRASAITGAPASAMAVAIPRPSPRLAPTTIVVRSDRTGLGVMVLSSTGWGWAGLALAGRGLGDLVRDLASADEHEDRRQGDERDRAEHPQRVLEAARQRRGRGVAGAQERPRMARGDARGDRDADRRPTLL